MPVRMIHPDHGITFAVGAEVEWNKKYGWKADTLAENVPRSPLPKNSIESIPSITVEDKPAALKQASPAERYFAKFGKKPHHRMAEKTILKALEE